MPDLFRSFCACLFIFIGVQTVLAESPARAPGPGKVEFSEETLSNGLHVIYAPLHQAPVVHVRVIYHVGSRDERPDRQGFAHMFEHMMFRGSAHVAPQEHMKLIGVVGGISNAFTSFDQTVYHDTIPSNQLDLALYLEADRMASFKVSDAIYQTERKVVAEEWRMRQNRPYGTLYEDFLKTAFTSHSYRWTPIGNMDHLRAAQVAELQNFFNAYYLPNNATLVIAGDIDTGAAQAIVHRYFGWIPAGPAIARDIPREPEQTAARSATVPYRVPLPAVMVGYHLPGYRSEDHEALELLANILGGGKSSRLDRLLVNNERPLAVEAYASEMKLEDAGIFAVGATVLSGRDPAAVEKLLASAVADVIAQGVITQELETAKVAARIRLVHERETATALAGALGEASLFGGDAGRINTAMARVDAVTPSDVRAVAARYLEPQRGTTLTVKPDPLGKEARVIAASQASGTAKGPAASQPAVPRAVVFPPDYPLAAKVADVQQAPHFQRGVESMINGVRVVVMPDPRLPIVTWGLTLRHGSHSDPAGKEGLASSTAAMLTRGAGGMSFIQLSEDLESRGISLDVTDAGDSTRVAGSCLTPQLDHALGQTRKVLLDPAFDPLEFAKLKDQTVNELAVSQETASTVASNDLSASLFGGTPLGRVATPQTVGGLTLEDVRGFYKSHYSLDNAVLIVGGDVTVERGQELARRLLQGWTAADASTVSYELPPSRPGRHILVVDRPGGRQATVRMGLRAYDIHAEDKFAGSVAGQILTAGIDSRLGRYVRAEKGLAYTVTGVFQPGRHAGAFIAGVDTAVESTADAVEAMFKVFEQMRSADVTPVELAQAKTRVAGGMVMGMQTFEQQAGFRIEGILNDYPVDYYDALPARIGAVSTSQVRDVMAKYVDPGQMYVVVVAPADAVREQLKRLGAVEVVPMPAGRGLAATAPAAQELLKPQGK